MTGRHRKPAPSAGLQLSRIGALAVLATAPLLAVGTASASPATGPAHSPEKRSHDHGSDHSASDRDDDSDDAGDSDDESGSSARHRSRGQSSGNGRGRTHYLDLADDDDDDSATVRSSVTRPASRSASRSTSVSTTPRSGSSAGSSRATDAQFDRLAQCESSRNWDADTGNGYKGGLQFNDSTWRAYGGGAYAPSADQASREEQIAVAKKLQSERGWRAWPGCAGKLGNA
jgi:hypothetical protein